MCLFGMDMDASLECGSLACIFTLRWNARVWLVFCHFAGMHLFGLNFDASLECVSLAWIWTLRWNVVLWLVF